MVRLEAAFEGTQTSDVLFQFLVVRLEVQSETKDKDTIPAFQFLVVRLEDKFNHVFNSNNIISIPCGAIRREKTGC